MHLKLQLAALFLFAPAAATAQIHSPQINLHRHHAQDLSWLWQYTEPAPDGNENQLAHDPRLKLLLQQNLTAPQSFWGQNSAQPKPLAEVALDYLGGPPGRVFADGNRYLNADACVAHFCPNRGLLWIDAALPHPLVVFSAIDWISDNRATGDKGSAYTMWVFSNQPLDPTHIPAALTRSIARWTAQPSSGSTVLQNITRVLLVDPDGTPHPISPPTIGAHNSLPSETSIEPASTPTVVPEKAPKAKP